MEKANGAECWRTHSHLVNMLHICYAFAAREMKLTFKSLYEMEKH